MSKIEIEWLFDSSDCETCGGSYAEGARVTVDGVVVLDLAPVAHCFGGTNYSQEDVYLRVLAHLGHEVAA